MNSIDTWKLILEFGTPAIIAGVAFITLRSEFKSHREQDALDFARLTKYAEEHYKRITELEKQMTGELSAQLATKETLLEMKKSIDRLLELFLKEHNK